MTKRSKPPPPAARCPRPTPCASASQPPPLPPPRPIEERLVNAGYLGDETGVRALLAGDSRDAILKKLAGLVADGPAPGADQVSAPLPVGLAAAVESGEPVAEGEQPASARDQILGLAERIDGEQIVGRDAEHREVAALLLAASTGPIVVAGRRGSGRTSFIRGLPPALAAAGIDCTVFAVPRTRELSPDDLHRLLRQAPRDAVIVIDDFDQRAMLRDQHPLLEMLRSLRIAGESAEARVVVVLEQASIGRFDSCLLYTSDAADDLLCVDLGGRRIIKQKKHTIYIYNFTRHPTNVFLILLTPLHPTTTSIIRSP